MNYRHPIPAGGEMGERFRLFTGNSLGLAPSDQWPSAIRATANLMLDTITPVWLAWGAELSFFYNDAYISMLGAKHPDVFGVSLKQAWAEVWPDVEGLVARALAGESVLLIDLALEVLRGGHPETAWFSFTYTPVRDDAGAVHGVYCSVMETTEGVLAARRRDQAEAALRQQNDTLEARVAERSAALLLFQDIVKSDPNPVCAFDTEQYVVAFNDTFADEFFRVYGYRPVLRDKFPELFLPEQRPVITDFLRRAIQGESFTVVEQFGHPDLVMPFWEISYNPLRSEDGTIIGAVQHGADISERIKAQEVLSTMQEALRQAQKMEAIGQLTGGVAHDFNNLLTIIRGSAELLKRPGLSDERRTRHIDAINETADRAAKLTGQLLAFARRQALTPELIEVGAAIDTVVPMVRTLMGSRVEIEMHACQTECVAEVDRSQLETAIVNLTVNARDAMRSEGRLTIAVRPVSAIPPLRAHPAVAGDFVAISVTDTGTGIAADDLARIFEPFFTTKPVGKGTGLGLSQVIGFTKQSGGDVSVESVMGIGATFCLYLPRITDALVVENGEEDIISLKSGDGFRVLLVEDNPEVGVFAAAALKELGYASTHASDATEVLAMLGQDGHQFDVVFSDVVMPGMSGIELGAIIRKQYPRLPVVLTSGYSHVLAENGQHGFELLHKPYSIEQLSRVLRKAIAWRLREGRAA